MTDIEDIENIEDVNVGGLRAVEVYYRGIREFESGETTFLQSRTRLNTPGLGTLMPETYRKVAELSNQCISLFELELTQVFETIRNLQNRDYYFRWISVYMPLRFLETRGVQQKLLDTFDEAGIDTNRICFELPPETLVEGKKSASVAIEQLLNRGFHFMLTSFGGVNLPLMKLAYFPVDYVMLSEEVLGYLKEEGRTVSAVESVIDFVNGMGAEAIADGVRTAEQAEALYRSQCRYGAGPLAGKYMLDRYLRKKKEE